MPSHPDLSQTELMRHAFQSCFSPMSLNGNHYRSVYFLSFLAVVHLWRIFQITPLVFGTHHVAVYLEASFIFKAPLTGFLLLKLLAAWEIDPTNVHSCTHWNASVSDRLHCMAAFFYLLYVSFSYLKLFLL